MFYASRFSIIFISPIFSKIEILLFFNRSQINIFMKYKPSHITPLLKTLHWFSFFLFNFTFQIQSEIINIFLKAWNDMTPGHLANLISISCPLGYCSLFSSSRVDIPSHLWAFLHTVPSAWKPCLCPSFTWKTLIYLSGLSLNVSSSGSLPWIL